MSRTKKGKGDFIPQRPSHSFVVHVRFVFMETPKPGDSLGINQLEYTLLPIGPLDVTRAAILILEQFEKEFPQVRR